MRMPDLGLTELETTVADDPAVNDALHVSAREVCKLEVIKLTEVRDVPAPEAAPGFIGGPYPH